MNPILACQGAFPGLAKRNAREIESMVVCEAQGNVPTLGASLMVNGIAYPAGREEEWLGRHLPKASWLPTKEHMLTIDAPAPGTLPSMLPFNSSKPFLAVGVLVACSCGRPAGKLPQGGDFVLQTPDGPLDTRTLRGKALLIFFSYTHCPDVCPSHLRNGTQAFRNLTPVEQARVRLLLVTVDPWRDTPDRMKDYAAFVSPALTGITGSPAEIAMVAKAFDAVYVKQAVRPDGTYDVAHTERTYLVAPDGKVAAVLGRGATDPQILAAVRKVL